MFYKVFDAHALTFVMTLAIPKPLPPTMLFVVLAGQRLKPIWEELQKHTALHYGFHHNLTNGFCCIILL